MSGKLVCPNCEREIEEIEEERTYDKYERLRYEWRKGKYEEVSYFEADPADPQCKFYCGHCGSELDPDEVYPRIR